MRITARIGHGVGVVASVLVALVPFALLVITQLMCARAVAPFLPAAQAVSPAPSSAATPDGGR
jgi:hypothetical protein